MSREKDREMTLDELASISQPTNYPEALAYEEITDYSIMLVRRQTNSSFTALHLRGFFIYRLTILSLHI